MASQYSLKVKGRQTIPGDLASSVSALVEEAERLQSQLNQMSEQEPKLDRPSPPPPSPVPAPAPLAPETARKLEEIRQTLKRLSAEPTRTPHGEAALASQVDQMEAAVESLLHTQQSPQIDGTPPAPATAEVSPQTPGSPLQRAVAEILEKQQQLMGTAPQSATARPQPKTERPRIRLQEPAKQNPLDRSVSSPPYQTNQQKDAGRQPHHRASPVHQRPTPKSAPARPTSKPEARSAAADLDAKFAHLTRQINNLGAPEKLNKVEEISTGVANHLHALDRQISTVHFDIRSLAEKVESGEDINRMAEKLDTILHTIDAIPAPGLSVQMQDQLEARLHGLSGKLDAVLDQQSMLAAQQPPIDTDDLLDRFDVVIGNRMAADFPMSLASRIESLHSRIDTSLDTMPATVHDLGERIDRLAHTIETAVRGVSASSDLGEKLDQTLQALDNTRSLDIEAVISSQAEHLHQASARALGEAIETGAFDLIPLIETIQSLEQTVHNSDDLTRQTFASLQESLSHLVHLVTALSGRAPEIEIPAPLANPTASPAVVMPPKPDLTPPPAPPVAPARADTAPATSALDAVMGAVEEGLDEVPDLALSLNQVVADQPKEGTAPIPEATSDMPLMPGTGETIAIDRSASEEHDPHPPAPELPSNRADFLAAARNAARVSQSRQATAANTAASGSKSLFRQLGEKFRRDEATTGKSDSPKPSVPGRNISPDLAALATRMGNDSRMATGHDDQPVLEPNIPPAESRKSSKVLLAGVALIALIGIGVVGMRMLDNTTGTPVTQELSAATTPAEAPALPASSEAERADASVAGNETKPILSEPAETNLAADTMAAMPLPPATADTASLTPAAPATEMPGSARSGGLSTSTPDAAVQPAPQSDLPALPAQIGSERLRQLAQQGNPEAQFEVGIRFAEGRLITQDLRQAGIWMERAARNGLIPAQYRVGTLYEKGIGFSKDLPTALSWYKQAADAGNIRAMHNLGVLSAAGNDGQADYETATQWFRLAADYGIADSQYNLGILHARGFGVEQDLQQSYKWFALAAKQGDNDAASKRDSVAKALDAQQLADSRSQVDGWQPREANELANRVIMPADGWGDTAALTSQLSAAQMIAEAQGLLSRRGYEIGEVDGLMGPKTSDAIKDFQQSIGEAPTGLVTVELLQALAGRSI